MRSSVIVEKVVNSDAIQSHAPSDIDVSVVIPSYNRPGYAIEAMKSVVDQKTNVNFEVILVRNYDDERVDKFVIGNEIVDVKSDDDTFIGKIRIGLQKASGKIVCFLEDDDLFKNNKISAVVKEFDSNSNLVYYHNFFDEIDAHGNTREGSIMRPPKRDIVIDTSDIRRRRMKDLFFYNSFHGTSQMSVRRKDFIDAFNKNDSLQARPVDLNLYLISCMSGKQIKLSKSKLSYYRVHEESNTFGSVDAEAIRKRYREESMSRLRLNKQYRNTFIYPLLEDRRMESIFKPYRLSPNEKRPSFRNLVRFSYYSFKKRNRYVLFLTWLLYLGLIRRNRYDNMRERRFARRKEF